MRSSNKFTVDACSIIDSGVVKTIGRAVEDECCLLRSKSRRLVELTKRGEITVFEVVCHP
jgi:hypothetical protein